jgi:hypothetical protein
LEVAFETIPLRSICEDEPSARRKLGRNASDKLRARLSDLETAENFTELPTGNPRIVIDGEKEALALDIGETHRLYLAPNHNLNPTDSVGKVDWLRVTRVRIIKIEEA